MRKEVRKVETADTDKAREIEKNDGGTN